MNSNPNKVFLNRSFDKKRLKALLLWFRLNLSEGAALKAVEILQGLGFRSATQGAISLGLDDLKTPASKSGRVFQAQLEVSLAHHEHHRGNRTPVELFQHLVDTWHRTSQDLTAEVIKLFHSTERVNPVYMMAFSGARGNISQVRQLVGMRGLMADPRGQIVGFPILSNFREGLTITEYFVSCYGARKGVVDTAIRTADAGYLTRRLADVSHHVVVRTTNCGTHRSINLRDIKEGQKTILSLANRLVGRVLAERISKPSGEFAQRNEEITPDLASKLASQHFQVPVRSPLSCSLRWGVCQLCYGWGLSEGRRVTLGEAVGIIAAQSIGEPGTQLTLRTFHTGGVFSGDLLNEIRAPYAGIVKFSQPLQGLLVRTAHGQIAFLTKVAGKMAISPTIDALPCLFDSKGVTSSVGVSADTPSLPLRGSAKHHSGSESLDPFTPNTQYPEGVKGLRACEADGNSVDTRDLIEFVLQPSTMVFVREKEQVLQNQLLAEFSSSNLQSTNDQIEITQQVLSETAGQVWFKEIYYGSRKGPGSGSLGTHFSSEKLGGIWVLAGKPTSPPMLTDRRPFPLRRSTLSGVRGVGDAPSLPFRYRHQIPQYPVPLRGKGVRGKKNAKQPQGATKVFTPLAASFDSLQFHKPEGVKLDTVKSGIKTKHDNSVTANPIFRSTNVGDLRWSTKLKEKYVHVSTPLEKEKQTFAHQHNKVSLDIALPSYLLSTSRPHPTVSFDSPLAKQPEGVRLAQKGQNLEVYPVDASRFSYPLPLYPEGVLGTGVFDVDSEGAEKGRLLYPEKVEGHGLAKQMGYLYSGLVGVTQSAFRSTTNNVELTDIPNSIRAMGALALQKDNLFGYYKKFLTPSCLEKVDARHQKLQFYKTSVINLQYDHNFFKYHYSIGYSQLIHCTDFKFDLSLTPHLFAFLPFCACGAEGLGAQEARDKAELLLGTGMVKKITEKIRTRKPPMVSPFTFYPPGVQQVKSPNSLMAHLVDLQSNQRNYLIERGSVDIKANSKSFSPRLAKGWPKKPKFASTSFNDMLTFPLPFDHVKGKRHELRDIDKSDQKLMGSVAWWLPKEWKSFSGVLLENSFFTNKKKFKGQLFFLPTCSLTKKKFFLYSRDQSDFAGAALQVRKGTGALPFHLEEPKLKGTKQVQGTTNLPIQIKQDLEIWSTTSYPVKGTTLNIFWNNTNESFEIKIGKQALTLDPPGHKFSKPYQVKGNRILQNSVPTTLLGLGVAEPPFVSTKLKSKAFDTLKAFRQVDDCSLLLKKVSTEVKASKDKKKSQVSHDCSFFYPQRAVSQTPFLPLPGTTSQETIWPFTPLGYQSSGCIYPISFASPKRLRPERVKSTYTQYPFGVKDCSFTPEGYQEDCSVKRLLFTPKGYSNNNNFVFGAFRGIRTVRYSNRLLPYQLRKPKGVRVTYSRSVDNPSRLVDGEYPVTPKRYGLLDKKKKQQNAINYCSVQTNFAVEKSPKIEQNLKIVEPFRSKLNKNFFVPTFNQLSENNQVIHYPLALFFAKYKSQNTLVITKLMRALDLNSRKSSAANRRIFSPLQESYTFESFATLMYKKLYLDGSSQKPAPRCFFRLTCASQAQSDVPANFLYPVKVRHHNPRKYNQIVSKTFLNSLFDLREKKKVANKTGLYFSNNVLSMVHILAKIDLTQKGYKLGKFEGAALQAQKLIEIKAIDINNQTRISLKRKERIKKLLTINPFWQTLSLTNYPNQIRAISNVPNSSVPTHILQSKYPNGVRKGNKAGVVVQEIKSFTYKFPKDGKKKGENKNVFAHQPVWLSVHISNNDNAICQKVTCPPGVEKTEKNTVNFFSVSVDASRFSTDVDSEGAEKDQIFSTNKNWQMRNLLKSNRKKKQIERNDGSLDQHIVHTIHLPIVPFLYIIRDSEGAASFNSLHSEGVRAEGCESLYHVTAVPRLALYPSISTSFFLPRKGCFGSSFYPVESFYSKRFSSAQVRSKKGLCNPGVNLSSKPFLPQDVNKVRGTTHDPEKVRANQLSFASFDLLTPKGYRLALTPKRAWAALQKKKAFTQYPFGVKACSARERFKDKTYANKHITFSGLGVQEAGKRLPTQVKGTIWENNKKKEKTTNVGIAWQASDIRPLLNAKTCYHSHCGAPLQGNLLPLIRQNLWEESCFNKSKTTFGTTAELNRLASFKITDIINAVNVRFKIPLPIRTIINPESRYTSAHLKMPINNTVAFISTPVKSKTILEIPRKGNNPEQSSGYIDPEGVRTLLGKGAEKSSFVCKKVQPLISKADLELGPIDVKYPEGVREKHIPLASHGGREIARTFWTQVSGTQQNLKDFGNKTSGPLQETPHANCFSLMQKISEYSLEHSNLNRQIAAKRKKLKYSPFLIDLPNTLIGEKLSTYPTKEPNYVYYSKGVAFDLAKHIPHGGKKGQDENQQAPVTKKNSLFLSNTVLSGNKQFTHLNHPIYLHWYAYFVRVENSVTNALIYYSDSFLAPHVLLSRDPFEVKRGNKNQASQDSFSYSSDFQGVSGSLDTFYPKGVQPKVAPNTPSAAFFDSLQVCKPEWPSTPSAASQDKVQGAYTQYPSGVKGCSFTPEGYQEDCSLRLNKGATKVLTGYTAKPKKVNVRTLSANDTYVNNKFAKNAPNLPKPILYESDQVTFIADQQNDTQPLWLHPELGTSTGYTTYPKGVYASSAPKGQDESRLDKPEVARQYSFGVKGCYAREDCSSPRRGIRSIKKIFNLFPGQLIAYGDNIAKNTATTESGQVLFVDSQKTIFRKAQTVLIYSQAIIAVSSGEWIRKGTPLMALSYQKLVTGDIVQGLPKIEQFFEAPVLKDGTFWGDSLQAKLNQFFQEHREELPLAEAVRKGFSEIQRVLVEGVQQVYISQGVLIADKHLEVIVRQMTCKGRILYSGDTGFLRNELVSLDKIESVNQVTYGQKALYHPQVRGITDASLESESFLSAASFQETTRVLSRDAIIGKTDLMRGLKERVIVGELIQAGTGLVNNNVYNLL